MLTKVVQPLLRIRRDHVANALWWKGAANGLLNPLHLLRLYARGRASARDGRLRGMPGMNFNRFGRWAGLRLLSRGHPYGLVYALVPVINIRYFEFPFTLSCLPSKLDRCLDIASPNLFSFYVAHKHRSASITIINPDAADSMRTATMAARLGLDNLQVEQEGVEVLVGSGETYNCIWSISVIEHIHGAYDDRYAVKLMYDALRPGGRLILTVPIGRQARDIYHDIPQYSTQVANADGRFFFERVYDYAALQERIIAPLRCEPSIVRWFGETTVGRFREYWEGFARVGFSHLVEDATAMGDWCREYTSWVEMPGEGVCGLMFEKPAV